MISARPALLALAPDTQALRLDGTDLCSVHVPDTLSASSTSL